MRARQRVHDGPSSGRRCGAGRRRDAAAAEHAVGAASARRRSAVRATRRQRRPRRARRSAPYPPRSGEEERRAATDVVARPTGQRRAHVEERAGASGQQAEVANGDTSGGRALAPPAGADERALVLRVHDVARVPPAHVHDDRAARRGTAGAVTSQLASLCPALRRSGTARAPRGRRPAPRAARRRSWRTPRRDGRADEGCAQARSSIRRRRARTRQYSVAKRMVRLTRGRHSFAPRAR